MSCLRIPKQKRILHIRPQSSQLRLQTRTVARYAWLVRHKEAEHRMNMERQKHRGRPADLGKKEQNNSPGWTKEDLGACSSAENPCSCVAPGWCSSSLLTAAIRRSEVCVQFGDPTFDHEPNERKRTGTLVEAVLLSITSILPTLSVSRTPSCGPIVSSLRPRAGRQSLPANDDLQRGRPSGDEVETGRLDGAGSLQPVPQMNREAG